MSRVVRFCDSVIYWLVIGADRCFDRWPAIKVRLFLPRHPFVLIADDIEAWALASRSPASSSATSYLPLCPLLFLSVIVLVSWSHPPSLTVASSPFLAATSSPSLTAFSPRFLTAYYLLPGCWFRRVFLPLICCSRSSLSSVLSFHADN
jgi:hypothetical protein